QGEDGLSSLVKRFATDDEACLFGTLSLWQGVDVPGRTCRLVVIDRIPFPRPDDPLVKARTESAHRAGANGFMSVSATHAALLLAQGAGRLIRSMADRGVVAVLDERLRTARYGGFLAASLPPMWRTEDPALVRGALVRARTESAHRAGANGFMSVSATHAALLLAQGAGRLIRSMADRGVVAVLDERLRTARYGGFLAASLPPMWRTEDPALVRGALE